MANAIIVVGLLVVLFGAGIWAFRPPAGAGRTVIKFLGFEVTLDVPALGVMALGVVLVLVGSTVLPGPPDLLIKGELSRTCRYTSGPKAGQIQYFPPSIPIVPAPIDYPCNDGAGSYGVAIKDQ